MWVLGEIDSEDFFPMFQRSVAKKICKMNINEDVSARVKEKSSLEKNLKNDTNFRFNISNIKDAFI